MCSLPPPNPPNSFTSCISFAGNDTNYLLLIGDPGTIGASGQDHNVHDAFNRSAQTQANDLQAQGHNVTTCRVSTIQDVYYAMTRNGLLDGGVFYFGHSGIRHIIDTTTNTVVAQTSEIFVGQATADDTNIS